MTYSSTGTETYTTTDIETVMRRFTADLVMIAQSSGAMSESEARDYAHDIELLAVNEYLSKVDITLLSGGGEVRATQYVVNAESGNLTMSRPGGVLWPRVANPRLRILIWYTNDYDAGARERMKSRLRIGWGPVNEDSSHASLTRSGGRDYTCNGWGLQRMDFAA